MGRPVFLNLFRIVPVKQFFPFKAPFEQEFYALLGLYGMSPKWNSFHPSGFQGIAFIYLIRVVNFCKADIPAGS